LIGAPKAEANPIKQTAKARRDRKAAALNAQRWRETMAKHRDAFDFNEFFEKFGLRL
jgi:hypothetical protein